MRAPAEKFVAYSDTQWREIKESLIVIGVDADALTVIERWWLPDLEVAPWVSLRAALEGLARRYAQEASLHSAGKRLTWRWQLTEQRKTAKLIEAALRSDGMTFSRCQGA
jgi:hypothetical protein